jgi:hypothetical protein
LQFAEDLIVIQGFPLATCHAGATHYGTHVVEDDLVYKTRFSENEFFVGGSQGSGVLHAKTIPQLFLFVNGRIKLLYGLDFWKSCGILQSI